MAATRFNGSVFLGYQNESFQTNNVTDELRATAACARPTASSKLYNIEGAVGGPIMKDKVWFFVSARNFVLNTLPADTFVGIAGHRHANRGAAAERRARRGRAEHPQRPGAHHLADEPEEQAGRLQRPAR